MTQYSGDLNNFPNDYTIVVDNTPRRAVSVNVALEALGDRTAWLKYRAVNGIDGGTYAGPITFTNIQSLNGPGNEVDFVGGIKCTFVQASSYLQAPILNASGSSYGGDCIAAGNTFTTGEYFYVNPKTYTRFLATGWRFDPADGFVDKGFYVDYTQGTTKTAWCSLVGVPNGATITQIRVFTHPGFTTPHTPNFPTTKNQIVLRRYSKVNGSLDNSYLAQVDPIANGSYDTYHAITGTGSHILDTENFYYQIAFLTEIGNFQSGRLYLSPEVTYSLSLAGAR